MYRAGVINAVTVVKNILIGLIVMIYLLNLKWTLCAQFKKIIYGLFSVRMANRLINEIRFAHHVFGGFIYRKASGFSDHRHYVLFRNAVF